MRTRILFVLSMLALTSMPLRAQTPTAAADEAAVRAVVKKLFDGMRTRDTLAMKATMAPGAKMFGVSRAGEFTADGPEGWISSIARAPAGTVLDEAVHDVEVRIDGNLATAWMYYDFFAGDRFSHCGYDAMQLMKAKDEWKIVALADSRRTTDCRQKRAG
jgi:hypothetical protein